MKRILIALILLTGLAGSVKAQRTTKIWVVRHAEKEASNSADRDPVLSAEGQERAVALAKYLKGIKLDSIFSTDYKRTRLTVLPTADNLGIHIKTYNPSKQKELADNLLKYAAGKNILIVGHSNTIQEMLVALGVEKPVKDLTEEDYDYIFRLTIKGNKKEVKVDRFGAAHHTD